MSFFGKKKDPNYKAILERKLYLAGVDPEPVFDLSECDLKSVPGGTYSLCKVMRKEHLYLQCNQLTRLEDGGSVSDLVLLRTLDLHSNKIATLSEDIRYLKSLTELRLGQNDLKVLPDGIGQLSLLRLLDVSLNRLKCLPSTIGQLKQLKVLYINGNERLTKLPILLGRCAGLCEFKVDTETLHHPPSYISAQGPKAILKYLSQECDERFGREDGQSTSDITLNTSEEVRIARTGEMEKHGYEIQEKVSNMAREKELRMKELAAIEKDLQDQQMKEFDLQQRRRQEKDKFLENLLEQESSLQNRLFEVQAQKDAERKNVIEHFQKVEEQSGRLLEELLAANRKMMDPAVLEERDRAQREEMLSLQTLELRRKEVMEAMEMMVAEELEQAARLLNYELNKDEEIRDQLTSVEELQNQIGEMAKKRDLEASGITWLKDLQNNCGKSGTALGLLLEKTDTHSQALFSEIVLAEQQLAALTSIELRRRQIDNDQLVNEIGMKRLALSGLLLDLLEQRDQRRQQLLDTLVAVQANERTCGEEDFWLHQYQRLMDRCPKSILKMPDPLLVHCLVQVDASHCLPYLLRLPQEEINEDTLEKMGVSQSDKDSILLAIKMYKEEKATEMLYTPSAPFLEPTVPSAPPMPSISSANPSSDHLEECSLCVVCMEGNYEVVFIPCGHLCVCVNCAAVLRDCPLCRSTIEQKIRAIVP